VLYQDQVLQVAIAVAGFSQAKQTGSPGHEPQTFEEEMQALRHPFFERARARASAKQRAGCLEADRGVCRFGFPKSHAVAFALLAYESAWLRRTYPRRTTPRSSTASRWASIRLKPSATTPRHGLEVLLPDVNASREGAWPTDDGIQLGLRQVTRLGGDWRTRGNSTAARIVAVRNQGGPFTSLRDLITRAQLAHDEAGALIRADALGSFGFPVANCSGSWAIRPAKNRQPALPLPTDPDMVELPALSAGIACCGISTRSAFFDAPDGLVRSLLHEGIVTSRHIAGRETNTGCPGDDRPAAGWSSAARSRSRLRGSCLCPLKTSWD